MNSRILDNYLIDHLGYSDEDVAEMTIKERQEICDEDGTSFIEYERYCRQRA